MDEVTGMRLEEIRSDDDPAWPQWLAIYRESFPVSERMSEESFRRVLRSKADGGAPDRHVLTLRDTLREPITGIVYYEYLAEDGIGYLVYIATRADVRGRGSGSRLYAAITHRLIRQGARMMVLEVEIPEQPVARGKPDAEPQAEWARRRIDWYRRQGACLLNGITYYQQVDTGEPPLPMWLMVHPFVPLSAGDAFAACKALFGDALTQSGEPALITPAPEPAQESTPPSANVALI